jgi:hypothetical protein
VTADLAIKHVVLLMMENHSFDQMLGSLQDHYPDLEGININSPSARFNLDPSGTEVLQMPTDEQQVPLDPKHENRFVLDQIANGNSGFVTDYQRNVKNTTPQDRQYVMGYYALGRLPALHALGCEFTVCDHWFSSLPGPPWSPSHRIGSRQTPFDSPGFYLPKFYYCIETENAVVFSPPHLIAGWATLPSWNRRRTLWEIQISNS